MVRTTHKGGRMYDDETTSEPPSEPEPTPEPPPDEPKPDEGEGDS